MMMNVTRRTIALRHLIRGHRQEVESLASEDWEPRPLDPDDCEWLPICRPTDNGLALVDGFHRLAGMVAYGAESLPVLVAEGADDLCRSIDCDSVIGECEELDAIYAAFTAAN